MALLSKIIIILRIYAHKYNHIIRTLRALLIPQKPVYDRFIIALLFLVKIMYDS